MNERILKLREQAGLQPYYDAQEGQIEKFAELIVREVFDKIEDERFEIYQPVKESVMKHFGVQQWKCNSSE